MPTSTSPDAASVRRDQQIVKTSVIGILANVFLAAFKAVVGVLSHSIAITLDAVNNLSDALSSVITIVGTKLAAKAPDKKHPAGHGRIEYLSATVIGIIVLYAGVQSMIESVKKIISPDVPDYSTAALIIVAAAIVVKLLLSRFFIRKGKDVSSDSLVNSGQDARNDAILSASTLAAALIFLFTKVSIEAYLGVVIAIIIIRSGIGMIREAVSEILGERVDAELSKKIKSIISSFEGVGGAYDLFLNNYGPNKLIGSVHIEIPDTYTAGQIDTLTRRIVNKVYQETGVILTGVSIYSVNNEDEGCVQNREKVRSIVLKNPYALQMHGFYEDTQEKFMQLDAVISFDAPDRSAECDKIKAEIEKAFPGFTVVIQMDSDLSD